MMNVVPAPGLLRTFIVPPCPCTMPCETQSPSPVPRSVFVEKNGSKMRACVSRSMPTPVSRTSIRTNSKGMERSFSPPDRVATVSVPPPGMASIALRNRLRRTCLSWSGEASMRGSAGSSSCTTRTFASRARFAMSPSTSATSPFMSVLTTSSLGR